MRKRALVSWSSGKDSAWMLHVLQASGEYEIAGLLTTINSQFDRVAMHGTRSSVLRAQASAAGIPLWTVPLPWPCSNQQYETAMNDVIAQAQLAEIKVIAFGDLFLQDIRVYRERQMAGTGIEAVFPLWGSDTRQLASEMMGAGLRARLVCLDPKCLSAAFAGREFDPSLIEELPKEVDPCGERGEFHTVAYAGPMFRAAISLEQGGTVVRDGFVYVDFGLSI
ncbi:MAG: ATP-binding protein [Acidobacteriaceae bacterium]